MAADMASDVLETERGGRLGNATATPSSSVGVPMGTVASTLVLALRGDSRGIMTDMLLLHKSNGQCLLAQLMDMLDSYCKQDRQQSLQALLAVAAGKSVDAQRALLENVKSTLAEVCCDARLHNGLRELLELLEVLAGRKDGVVCRPGETGWIVRFCLLPLHSRGCNGCVALQLARAVVCCCIGDPNTLLLAVRRIVSVCGSVGCMAQTELLTELQQLIDVAQTNTVLLSIVRLVLPLLRRAVCSEHFILCDKALCVLRSPRVLHALPRLASLSTTFSMLVPIIATTAQQHWDLHARSSALCTLQAFRAINAGAFANAV